MHAGRSVSTQSLGVLLAVFFALLLACNDENPTQPESEANPLEVSLDRGNWVSAMSPFQGLGKGKILWHRAMDLTVPPEIRTRIPQPFRLIYRPGGIGIDSPARKPANQFVTTYAEGIRIPVNPEIRFNEIAYLVVIAKSTDAIMHIDLGRISEDIDGDGMIESEDLDNNGIVVDEEDVGLDGIPDFLEPEYDPAHYPDPSGDNWYFEGEGICPLPVCLPEQFDDSADLAYYEFLNGTEGNRFDLANLGNPDAEHITDGFYDVTNAYFSFSIDFATDRFAGPGTDSDEWRRFRIPLHDPQALDTVIADQGLVPDWTQIRIMRVWFGTNSISALPPDTVLIADWFFEPEKI